MTEASESNTVDGRTSVLIVGGGITGLSAALFLARQGVRPILVERHHSTALLPQARAFNPRTMEIYRAFGLEDQIRDRTSYLADMPEMIGADTLAGQERFRIDLLAAVRPPATMSPTGWAMIDQDELERVVRAAAQDAGADLRFATELVHLDAGPDGVTAHLRDLNRGADSTLVAGHVIAADGHRAGIRTQLGVGADGPGVLLHVANAVFQADLTAQLRGRRFLLAYLDHPTTGTTLVPIGRGGPYWLAVPYQPDTGQRLEDFTASRWVELARAAIGAPDLEVALVPPAPGSPDTVAGTRIGGWVAQHYRAGRVFFAGDAAHVVPPSGSYGANTGIADAHNLAWKLAAVVQGRAGEELLATYDAERRAVAQTTLATAMRLLTGRHHGDGHDAQAIDDLTMVFGYRYASTAVLTEPDTPTGLLEDPRSPSGRPGLRAPHVWLRRDGATVSTLDLLGPGFTLLIGTDADPWARAARSGPTSEIDLTVVKLNDVPDAGAVTTAYGITGTGASLIRPDGFVAWRAPRLTADPGQDLTQALTRLLSRA